MMIAAFAVSCSSVSSDKNQFLEDFSHGESLYAINMRIVLNRDDQLISSTVMSQELLTWKQDFIRKYGNDQWQHYKSQMIKKYGHEETMTWFLQ
jgi:hypothetical protein